MTTSERDDLLWGFAETDDPEIAARRARILEVLLAVAPQVKERLIEEAVAKRVEEAVAKGIERGIEAVEKGRLAEARAAVRRVLARRQLALSPEDERRIEACTDLAILERWLDQSVTALSTAEALQ